MIAISITKNMTNRPAKANPPFSHNNLIFSTFLSSLADILPEPLSSQSPSVK